MLPTNITLKNVERMILCVCILLRDGLGLFWAVFDDLILLFMYSPPHERELRSQVVSFFFSLTHFPSLSCKNTHTQIHIYLAIWYHFRKYTSSFSAVCVLFDGIRTPLCQNWADAISSNVIRHVCVCAAHRVCMCLHLFNESTCCVCPLHSPIRSIASWVCQHGSCHGISANPINQTVH